MFEYQRRIIPLAAKVNCENAFNWSDGDVTNGRITNETGSTAESQCGWLFFRALATFIFFRFP